MIKKGRLFESICIQCILVGSVFVAPGTTAAEHSWSVKQLMHQLSEVSYAKLDFIETKQSIFLTTAQVIKGSMEYRAPDYLEKNTVSPALEKVVVDGDSIVVEKINESGQNEGILQKKHYSVQSHPALIAAVGSIRAVLTGNYEILHENYVMLIDGQREGWTLELIPKSAEILEYIGKIILSGNDARIHKYVTIHTDGDESVVALTYQILNKGNKN